jgi:hypothetical protein
MIAPLRTVLLAAALCAGAVAVDAQDHQLLHNRWKPDQYLFATGMSPQVAPVPSSTGAARWVMEPAAEPGFIRLRNVDRGGYLHAEREQLEVSDAPAGWWSAMWQLEAAEEGHVRIRNRWKNTYLHIENGSLELGALGAPGWWSAQWRLEPVASGTGALRQEESVRATVIDEERAVEHYVWIQTGGRQGAGTDADIYLSVRGRRTGERRLKLDESGDDFEAGSMRYYSIGNWYLGEISDILLENDGSSSVLTADNWYVSWACISSDTSMCHSDWRVNFNSWVPGQASTLWSPLP